MSKRGVTSVEGSVDDSSNTHVTDESESKGRGESKETIVNKNQERLSTRCERI